MSSDELELQTASFVMPKRCVAYSCGNINKDGVSLFTFPRDVSLKKWADQVKRTRDKWSGPTQYSFLCSCHFTTECFEPDSAIAASVGLKRTVRLKPDAVPSIFKRPQKQSVSTSSKRIKRYEERERRKVLFVLKYLFTTSSLDYRYPLD